MNVAITLCMNVNLQILFVKFHIGNDDNSCYVSMEFVLEKVYVFDLMKIMLLDY